MTIKEKRSCEVIFIFRLYYHLVPCIYIFEHFSDLSYMYLPCSVNRFRKYLNKNGGEDGQGKKYLDTNRALRYILWSLWSIKLSITKTCLFNFDPLKPHFYIVKLGFTGVYIFFFISAQKHRLWVLVRTASPR